MDCYDNIVQVQKDFERIGYIMVESDFLLSPMSAKLIFYKNTEIYAEYAQLNCFYINDKDINTTNTSLWKKTTPFRR